MESYICGFFDHDGTGDTTWSKFDSATFDCYWTGIQWPTSLEATTSERHKPTISKSERNTSSISKSNLHKSTVSKSERNKPTTGKSQRNKSSISVSEG